MNQLDLKGKTAVVTGGAAGIGLAIAQRLAHSGATVTLWDRDARALAEAAQHITGNPHVETVDVSNHEEVHRAVDSTLKKMSRIDVLVCSAGITGPNTTTWEYPVDAWKQVIDINLTGVFLCNKHVVPHMRKNDYGRIVNIASIAGKEGNPNAAAYSASKAGVISLTKSLGKEVAKTGMFEQMTQQHIDFMLSKIPMARFGQVEEIAAMVAWMCTEECSFSTGAVFDLSGGRAVY